MNPFAALTVTYFVSALMSLLLYYSINKDAKITLELSKVNWATIAFGIILVGLEVGWIYAYRAGWQVSTAQIVQSAFLASLLIFVGALLYKEAITLNKLLGVAICLLGLVLINKK